MRKVAESEVNNGNGLYDSQGLIDTLISDCNNAVKSCVGGQYIAFCNIMVQMVRKLDILKKGVSNEMKNRDDIIQSLKDELKKCGKTVADIAPQDLENQLDIVEVTNDVEKCN